MHNPTGTSRLFNKLFVLTLQINEVARTEIGPSITLPKKRTKRYTLNHNFAVSIVSSNDAKPVLLER